MDYLITFDDDSNGYLSHHGVKGMHWGVRNAETLARYGREGGAKPSKRQVKKQIKANRKAYAKSHGGTREVGEHTARVNRQHKAYKKNDKEYQEAKRQYDEASKESKKANDKLMLAEDHYRRTHAEGSNAPFSLKRATEDNYHKAKFKAELADINLVEADEVYNKRNDEIASKFIEKYRNAAVKDLGFHDIEAGKKLLDEYGLMRKATNSSRFTGVRHD